MIEDRDIPGADPAAVVAQFEPFIRKLAKRYTALLERTGAVALEDLHQVGRLAVLQTQKTYNPESGYTFMRCLFYEIRRYMRKELEINPNTGAAPAQLVYLDEPLPGLDGDDITILDSIADPAAVPMDEPLIDEETREETAAEVRAAVDRLKNAKQREVVTRCWLNDQPKPKAAADMGIKVKALQMIDLEARRKLRRDNTLKLYAMPFFHVGVNRFRSTWTSATEAAVLWRLEHLPQHTGGKDPEDVQTSTREAQP